MIDFFIITTADALNFFRVLFLIILAIGGIVFVVEVILRTMVAFSILRWLTNANLDILNTAEKSSWFLLIRDSYKLANNPIILRDKRNGYWRARKDWRYLNLETNKWVYGPEAELPENN